MLSRPSSTASCACMARLHAMLWRRLLALVGAVLPAAGKTELVSD